MAFLSLEFHPPPHHNPSLPKQAVDGHTVSKASSGLDVHKDNYTGSMAFGVLQVSSAWGPVIED